MKYLFISATLILSLQLSAQQRSTQSIGINEISVIELADNGDIWAGSKTMGVAFYQADSSKWLYYDSLNCALRSNDITAIALGPVGGIFHSYIGTVKGGVITQPTQWDTLANAANMHVAGILYRPDSLWVITGSSIIRYDSSFTFQQSFSPPVPVATCTASSPGNCSGVWVGTANNGCYFTVDGTNFTFIDTSAPNKKLVDNHVNAIAVDANCNRIFVGTKGGFSACPVGGPPCQNFTTANGLPENDIEAVKLGCGDLVWLGTKDSGIVVYDKVNHTFSRITTSSGLAGNNITALAVSNDCNTYAGTNDGNITQIDSNKQVIGILSGIRHLNPEILNIKVFPQPTTGDLNFLFESTIQDGELELTDVTEKSIKQWAIKNSPSLKVNVSDLAQGIYFYSLYRSGRIIGTGKVSVFH